MTKVLVTGAAGFAGTLLRASPLPGYDWIWSDIRRPDQTNDEETWMCGDLRDGAWLKASLLSQVSTVIHLGASSAVSSAWEAVLENNIVATFNVFEAARHHGVKKIIFASTNHVTGLYELEGVASGPDSPVRPDSLYGCSKAFGETLGRYYAESAGMAVLCLRIGSLREAADVRLDPRLQSTWLSPRDFKSLIGSCLENSEVRFGIYYGVSANPRPIWDVENLRCDLGFVAVDSAAEAAI